mmetsp:Transcript_41673/g.63090  ORF Transcript_41673/g.63090 Transcript_41673/m.63090 type:complete len:394 (-) Transcript_41673:185-1366(-)
METTNNNKHWESSIEEEENPKMNQNDSIERDGRDLPFPSKLHQIMSNPEFRDIITWLPHGRAWKMLNRKAFEEKVIPMYFRHCRYASFMRQVNGWGFNRIARGPDTNAYYHEMFLRGMPELCENIRRPTEKPAMKTYALSVAQTPDFYTLGDVNPTTESTAASQQPPAEETAPAKKLKPKKRRIIKILPQNRRPVATKPERMTFLQSSTETSSTSPPSSSQQLHHANSSLLGVSATQPRMGALSQQQQINNLLSMPAAATLLNTPATVSPLDILRLRGTQSATTPFLSALRYPNPNAALSVLARTSVMQSAAASQALLLAQMNGTGSLLSVSPQSNLVGSLGGSAAVGQINLNMASNPAMGTSQASILHVMQQRQGVINNLLNSSQGGSLGQR